MATFEDAWRAVKLEVPVADPLLCRKWVQYAYNELAEQYPWTFLFQETILSTVLARTLVVGLTQGDATMTSAALFVAGDVGLQVRVGAGPIYTIVTFTDASNVELDMVYAAATDPAASAVFSSRYVEMPTDFGSFETVIDQSTQRPVMTGYSQRDLLAMDPARTETSEPRILAFKDIHSTGATRYEWWPHPTTVRSYPTLYKIKAAPLADTFTFRGVLANREDVLVAGALKRAANWPGPSAAVRNPHFVLGHHDRLEKDWRLAVHTLGLRDDDQGLQSYSTFPWHEWHTTGLHSTESLRSSDATVGNYW